MVIIVTGSIRLLEGKREEMRQAAEHMVAASRAADGNVAYSYGFDVLDPDVMVFSEVWTDMRPLSAHLRSDHMARFREATAPLVDGRPEMALYEGEETSFG